MLLSQGIFYETHKWNVFGIREKRIWWRFQNFFIFSSWLWINRRAKYSFYQIFWSTWLLFKSWSSESH